MNQNASPLIWLDDDTTESRRQSIRSQAAKWSHHQNVYRKSRFRLSRGACACINNPSPNGCQRHTCRRVWAPNSLRQLSHKPIMQATFNASYEAIVGKRAFVWITHVAKSSDQSAVIKQSLAIIVGGIYSRSFNSLHLQHETNRRYVEIVGYIHKMISATSTDSCLEIVISILILAMVELIVWDNARKWMMHLDGISQLMQLNGPAKFCDGIGFLTLLCLRNQILALDIFKRRRAFLSCTPWAETLCQREMNTTPLDTISNILLDFPGLLEGHDVCTKNAVPFDQLDVDVLRYVQTLDIWKQRTISKMFPNTSGNVTMEVVIAHLMEDVIFEPEISLSVAYYLAGCLLIIRLGTRYTVHLSQPPNQIIDYIIMLCQKYLGHEQAMGSLTWLFPLRVAAYTPTTEPRRLWEDFRIELEKHAIHSFVSAILFSLPGLNTYIGFMDKKDRRVDGTSSS